MTSGDDLQRPADSASDAAGTAPSSTSPSGSASAGRMGVLANADRFSFVEAVGGWRGFVESAAPGLVFVAVYVIWGGFRAPVIASVATVAVLVIVRLIQRSTIQQALSGAVGVGIGAIWAWRSGEAGDYYVPGLWLNAAYLVALLASMAVRWPAVGLIVGLIRGTGTSWRSDPAVMRAMQWSTALVAGMFALRLAVQVPLYLAGPGAVAALGTAKLIMGVPLFVLTLWCVWLLVRNAAPGSAPQDPPQTRR